MKAKVALPSSHDGRKVCQLRHLVVFFSCTLFSSYVRSCAILYVMELQTCDHVTLLLKSYPILTTAYSNDCGLSLVVTNRVVPAHGHFVCACAKGIEFYEFGAICYFECAARGFLNGRSTLWKRSCRER